MKFSGLVIVFFWFAAELSLWGAAPQGWQLREGAPGGKTGLRTPALSGTAAVLPVELPERKEFVLREPARKLGLEQAVKLVIRLALPAGLPPQVNLTVFSQDNDYLWRQFRMPVKSLTQDPKGAVSLEIPLAGAEAVERWQCVGHGRPWNGLTVRNLLELGFRLDVDQGVSASFSGQVLVQDVAVVGKLQNSLKGIRNFRLNTLKPRVGQRLDVSFAVDGWVTHPFDRERFAITATVTCPGQPGKTEKVPGYYWEDFLYDENQPDKSQCLQPSGAPDFRIRYVPRTAGTHSMSILVRQGKQAFQVPAFTFEAQAAAPSYHGFVHVDPRHTDFFSYEDGRVFHGLGINVRSPFDDRYFGVAPYSLWRDMGLQAYEELFRRYHDIGVNVVEVWMCSWWLALEWIPNDRGFHGVGHYNQYRAWMLDRIMALAEEYGIHVILVLNNHGKFGMTYDTEWAHNPYNRAQGGYLSRCEEYFVHPRAKSDFKKTLDYIVARWGASPQLLSWKLFTEIDLTGQTIQAYLSDPNIPAWHQEMGRYLKSIDIYRHPVTTHWMLHYGRIDGRVARLKEVDFLSTDAYYSQGAGTMSMMSLITGAAQYGRRHKKPMVITEFGGSSYADTMGNLMNQVEVGLWTGFFERMGILPMYWWFGLVEDKQLHGYYRCLSRYSASEDRRDMKPVTLKLKGERGTLQVHAVAKEDRVLAWIMDRAFFTAKQEKVQPKEQRGQVLLIPVAAPGTWQVEFWNPATGEVFKREKLVAKGTSKILELALPEFHRSLALKVLR